MEFTIWYFRLAGLRVCTKIGSIGSFRHDLKKIRSPVAAWQRKFVRGLQGPAYALAIFSFRRHR